jgi:hypothetical protein
MMFYITPQIQGKMVRLKVELVLESPSLEQFKVTARNKTLMLQTNRLLFVHRGLKHRKGQWNVISGNLHNKAALEKIIEAIEEKL